MLRNKLTARVVAAVEDAGYFGDGQGLYLQVTESGAKSWIQRFMLNGRARHMGLGSADVISLKEARERSRAARKLLLDGIDPIDARKAQRVAEAIERNRRITFAECARRYIAAHRAGWKNDKHAAQWTSTIDTYANPVIGDVPVADVDTELIFSVLNPIWQSKHVTADRLRARLERILDWATTSKYRQGENPARWKGHQKNLLPAMDQLVKHHAALPYDELAGFMAALRAKGSTTARALEFTILTAARTSEVIGARPEEFDLEKAIWVVPAERMKKKKEHHVPISPRALQIVKEQLDAGNDYVFPGTGTGRGLSNMSMLNLVKRIGLTDLTVHGFRSTFRDWSAEQTAYPREVCELALAHFTGDATEAAYFRGKLMDKRRRLMAAWAKHCEAPKGAATVSNIRGVA